MADIYSANLIGAVQLAGNAGLAGQKFRSAGIGNQATWADTVISSAWNNNTLTITVDGVATNQALNLISADAGNLASAGTDGRVFLSPTTLPRKFTFTSPSNTSHTITHNLNNRWPTVTVYDSTTNAQVIPSNIIGTSANVLTVTFGAAVAITGTVVG